MKNKTHLAVVIVMNKLTKLCTRLPKYYIALKYQINLYVKLYMVNFLPLGPNEQKRDILHFSVQGGDEYNGTNVVGTNRLVQTHK